jgi:uncharacterized DUF497 family protein
LRVGEGRYACVGCTSEGRRLRVVFEVRTHAREVTAHVITAIPL